MTLTQIKIMPRQRRFIAREIEAGRFRDANEVLQAGLDLLEVQSKKSSLKSMIDDGVKQAEEGKGQLLKSADEIRKHTERLRKKAERLLGNA